jgi:antitoxin (DNA-binding transcriptional repressor) of toxin-antitoxin stability system
MAVLNAQQLHDDTNAILEEVVKGKTFQIVRDGKLIAILEPAEEYANPKWEEIMAEVWAAQQRISRKRRNPVIAERRRRRV